MNCSEFETELEHLVETRREQLSRLGVLQHLDDCADCRQRWQNQRLIDAALRAWRPIEPPAKLAESVMRELLAGGPRTVSRSMTTSTKTASNSRGNWMTLAAAAVCLLALFSLGSWQGQERPQQLAVSSPSPPATKPSAVEVATSVAAVFDDLRTEYRELATETSLSARDFAVVIPTDVSTVWSADRPRTPDPGTFVESASPVDAIPASGAVSSIGRSFGHQIGQAIDFLWAAVPDAAPRG